MARIRTIKPEFWTHPVMSRLPDRTQLLALALLSMADDDGYFHAEPAMVRGAVCPFRENLASVSEDLASLSAVGWIALWSHPEQGQLGMIANWASHQKIAHPTPSKLRKYDIREKLANASGNPRLGREGNREQGKEQGEDPTPHPPTPPVEAEPQPQNLNKISPGPALPSALPATGKAASRPNAAVSPLAWWSGHLKDHERALIEAAAHLDRSHPSNLERDIAGLQALIGEHGFDRVLWQGQRLVEHGQPPFVSRIREAFKAKAGAA